MTTGEKIRNRRLELKMTMEDLGRAVGVQRSAINKYEKGLVDITSSKLSAIANALGVSPVSLLSDEDDDTPRSQESKIISAGISKMPPERQKQALRILQVAFSEYADYFKEEHHDDT